MSNIQFKQVQEDYSNINLRRYVEGINANSSVKVSYQVLLKKVHDPIIGQAYDPDAVNYESVQAYVDKKLAGLTVTVDWDAYNEVAAKKTATLIKDPDAPEFEVGKQVWLRISDNPFMIVYKTGTHIVLQEVGSTEPLAWSYSTFFFKGPQSTPRVKATTTAEATAAETVETTEEVAE